MQEYYFNIKPSGEVCLFALVMAFFILFFCHLSLAGELALPDDHAPIGVMGDHTHKAGEWMVSYRYGSMKMDGNRDGTNDLTSAEVLSDFMVAPLDMTMEMHMFGLMYGVSDKLTLMGMGSYVRKSMNHVTRMQRKFEVETRGFGDTKLLGLFTVYNSGKNSGSTHRSRDNIHLNLGISLPTGDTDKRGDTPAGENQKLPYPMQLGSGTYDPIFAVTWVKKYSEWSTGLQSGCVLRFGENNESYRLGNEYGATAWVAKNLSEYTSLSLRIQGKIRDKIEGRDEELNPNMVPTARPDLSSRKSVRGFAGLNIYKPKGALSGNRLAIEIGLPLYQDLDGPQLKNDYSFTIGWQLSI
ncbi:MAG: transporter [Candidatus Dadabacteria bacterium]|nr:transporter [Candidatus Dadabacteria bacterium]